MRRITLLKSLILFFAVLANSLSADGQIVISQIYGGGGNSGASYKNDYVELYNRGTTAVSIKGWSIQYASATSTGTWSVAVTAKTKLLSDVTIQPGRYYLVQEAAGSGGTTDLPTPDATGSISMSSTAGKVALCNDTAALTTSNFSNGNPISGGIIVDFVGFGTANLYEGSGAATAPSNTTAIFRAGNGTTDTNDNKNDFASGTPNPRNSSYSSSTAAAPTFNPIAGNYDVAQTVTMSSTTSNAKIYYTTDGTTPDNTKTLYQSPINISVNTTIKAIAYDSNGANPSLQITTGTYNILTDVANIGALRANTSGYYKLTGEAVVTLKSSTNNVKYIQDATGAVLVYDTSGKITSTYALGDGMKDIKGTLSLYSGMLQFTPTADPGAASSTGNSVVPKVVTLSELVNHEAELVTVNNIIITDYSGGTEVFTASKNFPITGTTTEVIRTAYSDLDYIGQALPTSAVNVTGVVIPYTSGSTTTQELVPRSKADMVATGLFSPKVENLNVWVNTGKVVFNAAYNEKVEVFNAVGQKIYSDLSVDGQNTIAISAKGLLIVKVGNRTGKVIL